MLEFSHLYTVVLFVTACISLATAAMLWKRRSNSSAVPLFIFMVGVFVWSLSYAFFWLSKDPHSQVFWLNFTYFGVVIVPVSFLVFTLDYTSYRNWITRKVLLVLTVEPIITLFLLWTDPLHGLFFDGKRVASTSTILDGGVWFWMHVIYSYVITIGIFIMLVRAYRRSHPSYHQQIGMMLFAITLPWISNIISIANLNPLPNFDLTPLAFMMTGLIITYALFFQNLFKLAPIARDKVMEMMQEPVFVLDEQYRIVDINPSARRLLQDIRQTPNENFIGETITSVFISNSELVLEDTMRREVRVETEGQINYYEFRMSPLLDSRASQHGTVLILNNITRRKQVQERELEIKLEKERSHLLAEFIRTTSHEFRTPLAIINSSAYLTARNTDPEKRLEKAALIQEHVTRITKLIDMLLMISTLETTSLEFSTINVTDLFNMLLSKYPAMPEQASIQSHVAAQMPLIKGNCDFLVVAVEQLVDNARRYTPADGSVTLQAYPKDGTVVIEVQDTGVGIKQDDLPFIFNTFWRRDNVHSTPGMGVGLPIADKVVKLHGGKIEVESEPGKGSLFRVILPKTEAVMV